MRKIAVTLQINGKAQKATIAPGDLLLDVLRREGYVGAKRGCENGSCGACTVLVDGVPIDSCLMFAAQAEGKKITTIEGLAQGDILDPVQEAFLDCAAVQCGFCTPGMVLTAKAFLEQITDPTEDQAREMFAGNLCRCTGYCKPIDAVMMAARHRRKSTNHKKGRAKP
jgi:aerobic-type carbon monoxide dehydrogenase small subunit (CoxS/CutS family)